MTLSRTESDVLGQMRGFVLSRQRANREVESYIDGTVRVENLNIAVPPTLANIGVVVDWPETIVGTHHERLNFFGWRDNGRYGLEDVFNHRGVMQASEEALWDSCLYGVGFIAVEREITDTGVSDSWTTRAVSPQYGTIMWDAARQAPVAGYRQIPVTDYWARQDISLFVLYMPGENVVVATYSDGHSEEYARYSTVPGEVVICRSRNAIKSRRWYGKSMLTRSIRYYTQAAARTLLGMEINREFYTTPQRWAMNADMSMFTRSDNPSYRERVEAGWNVAAGNLLALPAPGEDDPQFAPQVGQFSAAPPTPYIEQLKWYASMIGSASKIPTAYFGVETANLPSGDSIRAWQDRLVLSLLGQIRISDPDYLRLGWLLAQLELKSRIDWLEFASNVSTSWGNPSTRTMAADADAALKLVSGNIVGANSDYVRDLLRMTDHDRKQADSMMAGNAVKSLADAIVKNPVVPSSPDVAAMVSKSDASAGSSQGVVGGES